MRQLEEILSSSGIRQLKRTPTGWKGCCAINDNHIDSKPSMYIHIEKGFVKCFSCGTFKPLFDFLLENGATFDEAVGYMFSSFERKESQGLQEWVLGRKIPKSMLDRGFDMDTLIRFKVGYDEVEQRITIPLEYSGILYGVQYREYPKNFYTSDGFNKDNFIYNFEPTEERYLTEGFTDCWRIWQNGTKNVEALLTASPSAGQLQLLKQHKVLNLVLDNDKAGVKGAFVIHKELGRDLEINVVPLSGKDAGEQTKESWKQAIEKVVSFTEFEVQFIMRNPEMYNLIKKEVYGK